MIMTLAHLNIKYTDHLILLLKYFEFYKCLKSNMNHNHNNFFIKATERIKIEKDYILTPLERN